jgi:uncharacterized protein with von Willebrand factor type A (vWA) domain
VVEVDATHLDRIVAGFAAALRTAGLDVPVGSVVTFRQALGVVGLAEWHPVYWAGRATLVHRPEDTALFDDTFAAYWHDQLGPEVGVETDDHELTIALDTGDEDEAEAPDDAEGTQEVDLVLRWSPTEVLRQKDFSLFTVEEMVEAQTLMRQLRLFTSVRPSRRQRRARHERGRLDIRHTVQRALRTEGEPLIRASTVQSEQPRRLVLLLDVSGSMEPYARALLRFAHAAVVSRRRVEAFALGTRLTRITRELSSRDPDDAFAAATGAVEDWSGGTRLGPVLREFNDEWGVRGMARGAVVVVLSDGWDRGDPAVLAEQMQRLGRVAHYVVWVNPLKATEGYEPLAAGMAAALPFVDRFIEGHNIASLEALVAAVAA